MNIEGYYLDIEIYSGTELWSWIDGAHDEGTISVVLEIDSEKYKSVSREYIDEETGTFDFSVMKRSAGGEIGGKFDLGFNVQVFVKADFHADIPY